MSLVSELSDAELELFEDETELSTINLESFVDVQEWVVYKNVEILKFIVDKAMEGKTAHHPCFSAKMHASRQCGYYIWNIYLFLVQEI